MVENRHPGDAQWAAGLVDHGWALEAIVDPQAKETRETTASNLDDEIVRVGYRSLEAS